MAPATPPSARYELRRHDRRRRARRRARSARTAAAAGWPAGRRPRRRAPAASPGSNETPTRPAGDDDGLEDLVGRHRRHAERALGDEGADRRVLPGAGRRSRRAPSPPPAGPSAARRPPRPGRRGARPARSGRWTSTAPRAGRRTRTSSPPSGATARTARSIRAPSPVDPGRSARHASPPATARCSARRADERPGTIDATSARSSVAQPRDQPGVDERALPGPRRTDHGDEPVAGDPRGELIDERRPSVEVDAVGLAERLQPLVRVDRRQLDLRQRPRRGDAQRGRRRAASPVVRAPAGAPHGLAPRQHAARPSSRSGRRAGRRRAVRSTTSTPSGTSGRRERTLGHGPSGAPSTRARPPGTGLAGEQLPDHDARSCTGPSAASIDASRDCSGLA